MDGMSLRLKSSRTLAAQGVELSKEFASVEFGPLLQAIDCAHELGTLSGFRTVATTEACQHQQGEKDRSYAQAPQLKPPLARLTTSCSRGAASTTASNYL